MSTSDTWGDIPAGQMTDGVTSDPASNVVGWDYNGGDDRPLTTFDLGSVYDVQTIELWARNSNGTITSIDISTSIDNVTYSTPVNFVSSWAGSNPGLDTLDVSALDNARYVRITPYSTDWSMFFEVKFDGDTATAPAPFTITEIEYHPDPEPGSNGSVTLTWRNSGAASYIAKVSTDLGDWEADIGDSLTAGNDENLDDVEHITATLPLPPGPEYAGDLFFRIEE